MVDVILPVLDERDAIPRVLARMPTGHRAIVVDNGSTDGSGAIARELGAHVVDEPLRGFGAACYAGLLAAGSDVVAFMDCDGSLDPRALVALTARVTAASGPALVLGRRCPERGAWPLHARVANMALARHLRRATGARCATSARCARHRAPRCSSSACSTAASAGRWRWCCARPAAGWAIEEVDVAYSARCGRSKVTGTVRGSARAVADMRAVLRELAV